MSTKTDRPHEKQNGKVMFKLVKWVRPYWASYIAIGGIIFISALTPVGQAEGIRRLINAIIQKSYDEIWIAFGLFAFVTFCSLVLEFVRKWIMQKLTNRSVMDLQREALEKLLRTPLISWGNSHSGDKIHRLFKSTESALEGLNQKIPEMIQQVLSIIFLTVYLSSLSWKILLGALAIGSISPLLSNLFSSNIRKFQKKTSELEAAQQATLQEQFQGVEDVRGLGLREMFSRRLITLLKQTRCHKIRLHAWQVLAGLSVFLGFWLGHLYILGIGAWMVGSSGMAIGTVAAFLVSYERLVYPLSHLLKVWTNMQDVLVHAGRVFELTDHPASKRPRPEPYASLPASDGIVLDHVSFGYEEGHPCLENVSAEMKHGQITAIVGQSGGGKSTLLKLILGLYEPNEGEVRMGGLAIRDDLGDKWRSVVAYVPQDFFILDASVMDNIRVGKLDATLDEIIQAAKLAGADDFIRKLPENYYTRLGERGQGLSGGERQRLALARALVRSPQILILDEPTSAVDAHNEQLILEALDRLRDRCTIVMVSHRLSTIRRADHILIMGNGQLIEQGTPQELLATGGRYVEMLKIARTAGDNLQEGQIHGQSFGT